MKTSEPPIVVEATYPAPPEVVWRAITEAEQMPKWFFAEIAAFEPRVGFETRFVVATPERTFPHLWKVTEVEPGERLVCEWRYEGYAGRAVTEFRLTPSDGGARLQVTMTTVEDFPDDVPEFTREAGEGGWRYFLQESLAAYLSR